MDDLEIDILSPEMLAKLMKVPALNQPFRGCPKSPSGMHVYLGTEDYAFCQFCNHEFGDLRPIEQPIEGHE